MLNLMEYEVAVYALSLFLYKISLTAEFRLPTTPCRVVGLEWFDCLLKASVLIHFYCFLKMELFFRRYQGSQ